MSEHLDLTRQEFRRQVRAFEDRRYSFGSSEVLDWISRHAPVRPDEILLEATAGTGWVSRALASQAAAIVATDITPEMLDAGRRAAYAAGLRNLVFQTADVYDLPFLDESFDGVMTRLGLHHLERPSDALRQMTRVCRDGGWLMVIDVIGPEGELGNTFNRLERLRDPSHLRALSADEIHSLVTSTGVEVADVYDRENVLDLDLWLAQTQPPIDHEEVIRAAIARELDGGAPTGLRPYRQGGSVKFVHLWRMLIGRVIRDSGE